MKKIMQIIRNSFTSNSFFGNAALYTIATMMTPAVGIILLPIYTAYMEPKQYGIMVTVLSLVGILQFIMLLSLHSAITRLYYDYLDDREEQRKYLGTVTLFVCFISITIAAVLFMLQPLLSKLLFSHIPVAPFYYYFIILSLLKALTSIPIAILRVQEKAGTFIKIAAFKMVLFLSFSLYLLMGLQMGADGALLANILSEGVVLIVYGLNIRSTITIHFSRAYIKKSLSFCLPLFPHKVSDWVINASDRYILEKFVSLELIGFYGLATQMSAVLGMLFMSINSAYLPRYTLLKQEGKHHSANQLNKYFLIIIVISGLLTIVLSSFIVQLLVSEQYFSAQDYLPVLLLAEMIRGSNYILTAKIYYWKNTKVMAISSIVAAVVNVGLNVVCIPLIGVWAAVLSTLVAEVVRLLLNVGSVKMNSFGKKEKT